MSHSINHLSSRFK